MALSNQIRRLKSPLRACGHYVGKADTSFSGASSQPAEEFSWRNALSGQFIGRGGGVGPRVLFLGTPGDFSLPPLEALLADGLLVCAVVVPATGGAPIIRQQPVSVGRSKLPLLTPFMNRTI